MALVRWIDASRISKNQKKRILLADCAFCTKAGKQRVLKGIKPHRIVSLSTVCSRKFWCFYVLIASDSVKVFLVDQHVSLYFHVTSQLELIKIVEYNWQIPWNRFPGVSLIWLEFRSVLRNKVYCICVGLYASLRGFHTLML